MKWRDLRVGDVVTHQESHETCLLLEKEDDTFTWFVLAGESYLAWGSNPYTIFGTKIKENIADMGWKVFRAATRPSKT